jgi:Rrf2 family nitric oxide-sensitive transcriptional repressor
MNLMECFDVPLDQCRISCDCFLKTIMFEARQAFMAVFNKYTLADAARPSNGATDLNLLQLHVPPPQDLEQ